MPHHERLLSDPVGTLRGVWDDTGWRTAIIAAVLIFLLETFADVGNAPFEHSSGWLAALLTLILIARVLALRPLRGDISTVENRSLLLGIMFYVLGEVFVGWTTLGGTFVSEPLNWPYSLMFALLLLAARAIAPYLDNVLNQWWFWFSFVVLWMEAGMWAGQVVPPSFTLTWVVMLGGAAILVRGIVARGFSGPLLSPLNVAVGLYIFFNVWLEYGAELSGVGWKWGSEELYWPWILWQVGLPGLARILAPMLVQRLSRET